LLLARDAGEKSVKGKNTTRIHLVSPPRKQSNEKKGNGGTGKGKWHGADETLTDRVFNAEQRVRLHARRREQKKWKGQKEKSTDAWNVVGLRRWERQRTKPY